MIAQTNDLLTIIALGISVLAEMACSGSSTTPSTADPFVGSWDCTGTETTTFTAPPDTPTATHGTVTLVAITDDGTGDITADRTPEDAGPPCALTSHLNPDGVSSTLTPGQTCISANGGTVTYTSGTATMNGTNARHVDRDGNGDRLVHEDVIRSVGSSDVVR
jgi:hypothetical protein